MSGSLRARMLTAAARSPRPPAVAADVSTGDAGGRLTATHDDSLARPGPTRGYRSLTARTAATARGNPM